MADKRGLCYILLQKSETTDMLRIRYERDIVIVRKQPSLCTNKEIDRIIKEYERSRHQDSEEREYSDDRH